MRLQYNGVWMLLFTQISSKHLIWETWATPQRSSSPDLGFSPPLLNQPGNVSTYGSQVRYKTSTTTKHTGKLTANWHQQCQLDSVFPPLLFFFTMSQVWILCSQDVQNKWYVVVIVFPLQLKHSPVAVALRTGPGIFWINKHFVLKRGTWTTVYCLQSIPLL